MSKGFLHIFHWIVVGLLTLACTARPALADDATGGGGGRRAGTIRLEAGDGRGPLELRAAKDSFAGELVIVNDGKTPLVVSRIAIHGDSADPRVPAKLVAKLTEGALPATIVAGGSKKVSVVWTPEKGGRLRQVFGHVVVTSSDEASGEVAIGVHAQIAGAFGPLEARRLSVLVSIPLFGAILSFLARASGKSSLEHRVAKVALGAQLIASGWMYLRFAPEVSRADGNDGLQFVEHVVWIRSLGAEIYLGVDGIGAGALVATSLVGFFALVFEGRSRHAPGYPAAFLLLSASTTGALVAMDGLLFVLFASVAVVVSAILVGAWGGADRRLAATRFALHGIVAVVLLLVSVVAIAMNSDPTFLVDGSRTTTSFSLPELSRVAFGAKGATIFGASLVKVAFALVLAGSVVLLGVFPGHGWISSVVREAPTGSGVLIVAALPSLGTCALLRIGCAVLPEGMRWGSGVVAALGTVTIVYGALGALGQGDLRRIAARTTTSQVGFILLGAGSLTPQGISGAIFLTIVRAVVCGLFLLLAAVVDERARTHDVGRLSGVASQMPGWAAVLTLAALGQAGLVGFAGGWGPMLAIAGALPNYAPFALVSSAAIVVVAATHLRAVSRLIFGRLSSDWASSPALEPFGGRFPDLVGREWLSVGPLATLVLLLGIWPAPLLASTAGTTRDLTNAVSPPGPEQVASQVAGADGVRRSRT